MRSFVRSEWRCILDLMKKCHYNGLGLYMEGAFEDPDRPGVPRPGSVSQADVDFLKEECAARGIFLFPLTNVMFHMEHFLCQERYADLRDTGAYERNQIHYEDPRATEMAMHIIHAVAKLFGTTYIHIGCDEAILPRTRIDGCGQYIANICKTMLKEGLTPAVWSDMFWMEPQLAALLPRETEIFDWNYYGHRPESIQFFQRLGFRHVYPAPCDNGWEGFINYQRVSGHLKARTDLPVQPDEVEAFLEDGVKENVEGGVMTHWEDTSGRSFWSTLVPFARAGLYMNGLWDPNQSEEAQVEPVLFGRITPYTAITRLLRSKVCGQLDGQCAVQLPADSVFRASSAQLLLTFPEGFWRKNCIPHYEEAVAAAIPLLESWTPEGELEDRAKRALTAVVEEISASLTMMRLADARTRWHEAALCQFTDRETYRRILLDLCTLIQECAAQHHRAAEAQRAAIADNGVTTQDLRWQLQLFAYLEELETRIRAYAEDPALENVALKAWYEMIYGWDFSQGGTVLPIPKGI